MGGAAGHMAHPFDLPEVDNGNDLIDFFKKAAQYVHENEASVKIDGVNVSFKLVNGPAGKEFAVDRGSLKPIDIQGITYDRIEERFPEGHGMRDAIATLLTILNQALPKISKELEELGMTDNSTLFLNTEYVAGSTNVLKYDENFLAIHGLNQFYQKIPRSAKASARPGAPRPEGVKAPSKEIDYDPKIMARLIKKLNPTAQEYGFKVYGSVPTQRKSGAKVADFSKTLSTPLRIQFSESEEITKSIQDWLREATNPRYQFVNLTNGKKVGALSKLVYLTILGGEVPVTEFIAEGGDVKPAIYGAVFYHATRLLGNDILEVLTSPMGDVTAHEGVVLRDDNLFGPNPVKITGEFIVGGMVSSFQAPSQPIAKGARTTVAVVPGAFKPPHKGHMAMVEHYSAIANKVVVFISPLSRPIPGGGEVTFEESKAIWNLYIENSGLSNVVVSSIPSTFNSPVQAAYEFAANESQKPEWLQAGEHIIYGASDKPDKKEIPDFMRFKGGDKYVREDAYGGALEETQDKAFKVSLAGPALSASDLRAAIGAGDTDKIDLYVPPGVDPRAILDILGVKEPAEEEPFTMEDIMEIVNQELDEISSMQGGDMESGAMRVNKRGRATGPFKGFDTAAFNKRQKEAAKLKRKKKKKKEEKIDEDEMVNTILDYLVNKGMAQ